MLWKSHMHSTNWHIGYLHLLTFQIIQHDKVAVYCRRSAVPFEVHEVCKQSNSVAFQCEVSFVFIKFYMIWTRIVLIWLYCYCHLLVKDVIETIYMKQNRIFVTWVFQFGFVVWYTIRSPPSTLMYGIVKLSFTIRHYDLGSFSLSSYIMATN